MPQYDTCLYHESHQDLNPQSVRLCYALLPLFLENAVHEQATSMIRWKWPQGTPTTGRVSPEVTRSAQPLPPTPREQTL